MSMTHHDEANNEIGRRLGAAYTSYIAGHKNVDQMLKRVPVQAGTFWCDLAQFVSDAMFGHMDREVRLRQALTKYIQKVNPQEWRHLT